MNAQLFRAGWLASCLAGPWLASSAQQAATPAPRQLEATLFLSHTQFDNGPGIAATSKNGVRLGELAYAPQPNQRYWVRYDNGLSLDNADLARRNATAATTYLGGFVHYLGRYTTRLELGQRKLPGGGAQNILGGEQVIFFADGYNAKAGVWLGRRDDGRTERVFHAGLGIPLTKALRFEPTLFHSRSGVVGEKQSRGLLAAEYAFDAGQRLGGGVSFGRAYTAAEDHAVRGVSLTGSTPFAGRYRAHLFLSREEPGLGRTSTVFAVGLTRAWKE